MGDNVTINNSHCFGEMKIQAIKPDWLRREIVEALNNGKEIVLKINSRSDDILRDNRVTIQNVIYAGGDP